jgi:hypothetical protein
MKGEIALLFADPHEVLRRTRRGIARVRRRSRGDRPDRGVDKVVGIGGGSARHVAHDLVGGALGVAGHEVAQRLDRHRRTQLARIRPYPSRSASVPRRSSLARNQTVPPTNGRGERDVSAPEHVRDHRAVEPGVGPLPVGHLEAADRDAGFPRRPLDAEQEVGLCHGNRAGAEGSRVPAAFTPPALSQHATAPSPPHGTPEVCGGRSGGAGR